MRNFHNIGAALKQFEKSLQKRNAQSVADALAYIITNEPDRWRTLTFTSRALPQPKNPEMIAVLKCLLEALGKLAANDAVSLSSSAEFAEIIGAMVLIHRTLTLASEKLEGLTFWKLHTDAQTIRMAAFVESQHRLGRAQMFERRTNGDAVVASFAALDSSIESDNGIMVNLIDVYESNVEAMELNLRYSDYLMSSGRISRAAKACDLRAVPGPYGDPDFSVILYTAAIWESLQDVWEKIRYSNWHFVYREEEGIYLCLPRDEDELIRSAAAQVREREFQVEFGGFEAGYAERMFGAARTMQGLAETIVVPPVGVEWDGMMDLAALRMMTSNGIEELRANLYIDFRHYSAAVDKLRVGGGEMPLDWHIWLRCFCVLRIIAQAFDTAIGKQVSNADNDDCMRSVIVVHRVTLANVLSAATNFSRETCERAIKLLTFNAKRRKLELWDQPLLSLQGDRLLITPSLITGGSPARAIENMLSEWGDDSHMLRGTAFEDHLASIFEKASECVTARRVEFVASDGKKVEYDVIVWWNEHLFLLEGKCLRAVYAPAEEWAAKKQIEEAIDQLDRRRRLLYSDWNSFRSLAPALGLPDQPPPPERVSCIAVPSISTFTGYIRNNVHVVDERCIARFFGGPTVDAQLVDPDGGIVNLGAVERIRPSDELRADEFRVYLQDLPLVRWVREGITVKLFPLLRISDTDPKVAIVITEYKQPERWTHGLDDKLRDAQKLE